jgi:hypothetical protein
MIDYQVFESGSWGHEPRRKGRELQRQWAIISWVQCAYGPCPEQSTLRDFDSSYI